TCGWGNPLSNTCATSSHELVESITDPLMNLATGLGSPVGWYAAKSGEIGDICNDVAEAVVDPTTGMEWTVQKR
ncbi:hypothetical protein HDU98_004693, partial [Podochytrium sp. JEL0797]